MSAITRDDKPVVSPLDRLLIEQVPESQGAWSAPKDEVHHEAAGIDEGPERLSKPTPTNHVRTWMKRLTRRFNRDFSAT